MKLTHQETQKQNYSKPVIYKIDPNDPRISDLQALFEPPKKKPTSKKVIHKICQPR